MTSARYLVQIECSHHLPGNPATSLPSASARRSRGKCAGAPWGGRLRKTSRIGRNSLARRGAFAQIIVTCYDKTNDDYRIPKSRASSDGESLKRCRTDASHASAPPSGGSQIAEPMGARRTFNGSLLRPSPPRLTQSRDAYPDRAQTCARSRIACRGPGKLEAVGRTLGRRCAGMAGRMASHSEEALARSRGIYHGVGSPRYPDAAILTFCRRSYAARAQAHL